MMAAPFMMLYTVGCQCLRSQRRLVRRLLTSPRPTAAPAARGAAGGRRHADFDRLGTWDSRLELPLQLDASIKHGKPIPRIDARAVGTSSLQGKRRYQEDRCVVTCGGLPQGKRRYQEDRCVVSDVSSDILLAAILDGHGGHQCSQFCADHLLPVIQDVLANGEKNLMTLLHETFPAINRLFADHWHHTHGSADSPGSTATVCLLRGGAELVIGHVGDSRAILCRDGEARKLTTDHSAALLAEKRRVEQSGGSVTVDEVGRHMVNGRLSMTRSIGDLHLKKAGVTAFPDTRSLEVKHGRDAFLVLTSDGINHVMTDQEICDVIGGCRTPAEGAAQLTDQALSYSSSDNISCLVVPFGSWGKFIDRPSMFTSFGKTMSASSRFS